MSNNSKPVGLLLLVSLLIMAVSLVTLAQADSVTNLDTGESFETIQGAIDDSDTADGHTIEVDSSTYDSANEPGGHSWDEGAGEALILIDKSLTIQSTGGPKATVIDGRGSMVTVGIQADGVTFTGFTVTGAEISPDQNYSAGIDVDSGFADAVISNNIITGNQYLGIDIYNADGCTITDNVFKNMEIQPNRKYIDAIAISKATNTEISNNTIHHIGDPNTDKIGAMGIRFNQVTDSVIENNEIYSIGDNAILLTNKSSNNRIVGNTVQNTYFRGLLLFWESNSNTVEDNEFTGSRHYGIGIEKGSAKNTIVNNEMSDNELHGLDLHGASDNVIRDNKITNNGKFGIQITPDWNEDHTEIIYPATGNEILHNSVSNNDFAGINLAAANNLVKNNNIYDNGRYGVCLWGDTSGNSIIKNEISGTYLKEKDGHVWGMGIYGFGVQAKIKDNHVHDNAFGIIFMDKEGASITGNTIENNNTGQFGMLSTLRKEDDFKWEFAVEFDGGSGIYSGANNKIIDNKVTGNGFGIVIQGGNSGNLVKNNTVKNNSTGKTTLSVQKWEETTTSSGTEQKNIGIPSRQSKVSPKTAQPQSWEKIKTLEVAKPGSFGLLLTNSSSTTVEGNTLRNNGDNGIAMYGFSFPDYDLQGESDKNEFHNNEVKTNKAGILIGPFSRDNTFQANQISDNTMGIMTKETTGNVFHENSIKDNEGYGTKNTDDQTLDATDNWWGDKTGPYHPDKNPSGQGNQVSDKVAFDPWLEISPFATTTTLPQGWNLFSPPGIPQTPDPGSALGDDIDPLSLFYNYSNGSYTNYPDTSTQLTWKQGCWVKVSEDTPVNMDVAVPTQDYTLEFTEEGWNMIGMPYSVDWSQVSFSDPTDFQTDGAGNARLVSWEPIDELYLNHYSGDLYVLSPWGGYWVKVKRASSDNPASLTISQTNASSSSLATKTPLPQSVDRDQLDYPPLPQELKDNFQVFVYPNPVMEKDQVTFTARMANVEKIKVTVTNMAGELVYDSGYKLGNKLVWNLKSSSDNKVANGIYLYKIQAIGTEGTAQASQVKRLLVLR